MFPHLFAPSRIKSTTLRNRIVSTAHNTGLNDRLRIGDRLLLSLFQRKISAHVRVAVATSSLMQVPRVQATFPPGKRVGLLTISS